MVVECLRDLSDLNLQRRAWLAGDDRTLPSPTELICQLFDDTGLDEELEAGQVFSPKCDAFLRNLSRKCWDIDVDRSPRLLLEDSNWHDVANTASVALLEIEKNAD